MSAGAPRIETTHVGSLIRPDAVIEIMRRLDRGEAVDAAEHQAVLAPAVREVVRRQKQAGVTIVSDQPWRRSAR